MDSHNRSSFSQQSKRSSQGFDLDSSDTDLEDRQRKKTIGLKLKNSYSKLLCSRLVLVVLALGMSSFKCLLVFTNLDRAFGSLGEWWSLVWSLFVSQLVACCFFVSLLF